MQADACSVWTGLLEAANLSMILVCLTIVNVLRILVVVVCVLYVLVPQPTVLTKSLLCMMLPVCRAATFQKVAWTMSFQEPLSWLIGKASSNFQT